MTVACLHGGHGGLLLRDWLFHTLPSLAVLSVDRVTQALAVRVTCAFEQLAVLVRHWLSDGSPWTRPEKLEDELRQEVRKLGGYLQLFLQGCCSDISSMVKEAQKKEIQTVQQAVKYVGQLAVLKGSKLHFLEINNNKAASVQEDFLGAVCDGVGLGMKMLLDSGLEKAKELQHELLQQCTQSEATTQMKTLAMGLIGALENIFAECKTKSFRIQIQEENSGYQDLKKMVNHAPEFLKLKHCLEQTIHIIISALRGCHSDINLLRNCTDSLCSLAGDFHRDFSAHPVGGREKRAPRGGHRELDSLVKALLVCFESEGRPDLSEPWEACNRSTREGGQRSKSGSTEASGSDKGAEHVHGPRGSPPAVGTEGCVPSRIQWV
ncbi:hypothetical protein MC885_018076 [Smutsia gigantea]|nr:hypothetical protein MC885_018076 [Smutsia gigantea]